MTGYLSTTDVMKKLNVSRTKVVSLITKGFIKGSKQGRNYKIKPEDLMAYMAEDGIDIEDEPLFQEDLFEDAAKNNNLKKETSSNDQEEINALLESFNNFYETTRGKPIDEVNNTEETSSKEIKNLNSLFETIATDTK